MPWSEVAQSCPTLCDPVDCGLPDSSVHGILQARVLEWGATAFSRGSSQPRDQTQVSRIGGRRFKLWATREAPSMCHRPTSMLSACELPSCYTGVGFIIWLALNTLKKKKNYFLENLAQLRLSKKDKGAEWFNFRPSVVILFMIIAFDYSVH